MEKKPARSRNLIRMLILGLAAAAGGTCSENQTPTSPSGPGPTSRPLNQRIDTAGITFLFAVGDSVNTAYQQTFHEWHDFLRES
jgi:ABC-type phosphate transport system substrate-binding protein